MQCNAAAQLLNMAEAQWLQSLYPWSKWLVLRFNK